MPPRLVYGMGVLSISVRPNPNRPSTVSRQIQSDSIAMHNWIIALIAIAACSLFADTGFAKTAAAPTREAGVNRGVVQLETARAGGISVRIAEDIANIVDDGATRRVLPV